jgi:hypothetical protein
MGRSILAVLAGFCTIVLLVIAATAVTVKLILGGGDPAALQTTPTYLGINLAYSALAAVLGGYFAGRLARRAALTHAGVLAGIIFLMGVMSLVGSGGRGERGQPGWYPYILTALGPIGIIAGGWVARRRERAGREGGAGGETGETAGPGRRA